MRPEDYFAWQWGRFAWAFGPCGGDQLMTQVRKNPLCGCLQCRAVRRTLYIRLIGRLWWRVN